MSAFFLKKIFLPPKYLLMKPAGVNINDRSIRYAEFSSKKDKKILKNFGEIIISEGVLSEGEILNKNLFTKILLDVKKELSTTFIKVSISEEKTYIFDCLIPNVDDKDIAQAIEFKLEENVPYKSSEVYFEYEIVRKPKISADEILLSVAVVPKKIIDDYIEIMQSIGLFPVAFEVESKAIAKSVIKEKSKNHLIININEDSSIFSICTGKIVRLTSVLAIGSSAVKNNLLKIDPSFFKENGEFTDKAFISDTSYSNDIFSALLSFYSIIKDDLNKFIEFIHAKSGSESTLPNKIDTIILCGESAYLPGFLNYIKQNTNIDVELANVWTNIFDINTNVPQISFRESLDFATATGLTI